MEQRLKDITAPYHAEVVIRYDSKVLWVNIDGKCEFRACQIENLTLNDQREPRPTKWEDEAMRLKNINVSLLTSLVRMRLLLNGRILGSGGNPSENMGLRQTCEEACDEATVAIEAAK